MEKPHFLNDVARSDAKGNPSIKFEPDGDYVKLTIVLNLKPDALPLPAGKVFSSPKWNVDSANLQRNIGTESITFKTMNRNNPCVLNIMLPFEGVKQQMAE
jgi:hypothetical protein